MKIKLSYFLSKRKTNLSKYCKDNSITSYDMLTVSLREHRVKAPPESEFDSLQITQKETQIIQEETIAPTPVSIDAYTSEKIPNGVVGTKTKKRSQARRKRTRSKKESQ